MTQKYCVKGIDQANKFELKWPRGSYCIMKYRACPAGEKMALAGYATYLMICYIFVTYEFRKRTGNTRSNRFY